MRAHIEHSRGVLCKPGKDRNGIRFPMLPVLPEQARAQCISGSNVIIEHRFGKPHTKYRIERSTHEQVERYYVLLRKEPDERAQRPPGHVFTTQTNRVQGAPHLRFL